MLFNFFLRHRIVEVRLWNFKVWKSLAFLDGFGMNFIKTFLYQVPTTCQTLSYILANLPKNVTVSKFLGGTEDILSFFCFTVIVGGKKKTTISKFGIIQMIST